MRSQQHPEGRAPRAQRRSYRAWRLALCPRSPDPMVFPERGTIPVGLAQLAIRWRLSGGLRCRQGRRPGMACRDAGRPHPFAHLRFEGRHMLITVPRRDKQRPGPVTLQCRVTGRASLIGLRAKRRTARLGRQPNRVLLRRQNRSAVGRVLLRHWSASAHRELRSIGRIVLAR